MLDFLKSDAPPKVPEHSAVIERQRQVDEGESAWSDLDQRFARVSRIVRLGPGGDVPADASEQEIEEAFAIYPQLRREHFDAKQARAQRSSKLATAKAAAQRARQVFWQGRLANALEDVVSVLDGPFSEQLRAFFRLQQEAAMEGLAPTVELPGFCYFDSPLQPGLDSQLRDLRAKVENWRLDAARDGKAAE